MLTEGRINTLNHFIQFRKVSDCIYRKYRAHKFYGPHCTLWKIDIPDSVKWMIVFVEGFTKESTSIQYSIMDYSKKEEEECIEYYEETF